MLKSPTPERWAELAVLAHNVVSAALKVFEGEIGDRFGGIFCYSEDGANGLKLVCPAGEFDKVPHAKIVRYLKLAQEKYWRLKELRSRNGDASSYESRDPDKDQWGGGVCLTYRGDGRYYSFSGLPELLDEAICLVIGIIDSDDNPMARREAERIAKKSHNPFFSRLTTRVEELAGVRDLS